MLGEVVKQRLAFTHPLEMALTHVRDLPLRKAHWRTKKGKASGRPQGDLSNVDVTLLNTPELADAAAAYYGQILHVVLRNGPRFLDSS